MNASRKKPVAEETKKGSAGGGTVPASHAVPDDQIDGSLLEDSLAMTPWERMQANDDALRFADSLRTAMEKRDAKP